MTDLPRLTLRPHLGISELSLDRGVYRRDIGGNVMRLRATYVAVLALAASGAFAQEIRLPSGQVVPEAPVDNQLSKTFRPTSLTKRCNPGGHLRKRARKTTLVGGSRPALGALAARPRSRSGQAARLPGAAPSLPGATRNPVLPTRPRRRIR